MILLLPWFPRAFFFNCPSCVEVKYLGAEVSPTTAHDACRRTSRRAGGTCKEQCREYEHQGSSRGARFCAKEGGRSTQQGRHLPGSSSCALSLGAYYDKGTMVH